jgi:signal transduction histidine kinase
LQEQQEEVKQTNEELAQANLELEQTNSALQQTNVEMEERASLLAEQKREVERTNREVEKARDALKEQARQLAQTSKYKSEFLANMSHELRTPLNSLLILSKILSENAARNLTDKQVQYAQTIHSSGNDLLELINDILDLSKIESGSVELELNELSFGELGQFLEESFRHVAETRGVAFTVRLDPGHPPAGAGAEEPAFQRV